MTKSNFTIPPPPLEFRQPLDAPLTWLGPTDLAIANDPTAEPHAANHIRAPELTAAKSFLTSVLCYGDQTCSDIHDPAQIEGVTIRTLRRARDELGVTTYRNRDGKFTWSLPNDEETGGEKIGERR